MTKSATATRILFVEDVPEDTELAMIEILKAGLAVDHLRVDTESDFRNALESFKPDIVVSDYSMPSFDGMRALKILKSIQPDLPLIILTGSMNESTAVACMKAGANDYVIKEHISRLPYAVKEGLAKGRDLAEKAAAIRQLDRSEARYRGLFEHSAIPTMVWDLSEMYGYFRTFGEESSQNIEARLEADRDLLKSTFMRVKAVDANLKCVEFFGAESKADLLSRVVESMAESHLDAYLPQIVTLARGADLAEADLPIRTLGGEERTVSVRISVDSSPAAPLSRVLISFLDITEKKRAEEEFRKLSRVVEQAQEIVFVTDREGVIEYVNPAFERLTGYSREEAVGKTPRIIKSGEINTAGYEGFWKSILTGTLIRGVMPNRKKNGELFYEEKTVTPLRDETGAITHFVSTGNDISERIKAERALAESEVKFRSVIEQSAEGIALLDGEGKVIVWNKAEEAITGIAGDEAIGQYLWDVQGINDPQLRLPEAHERNRKAILDFLSTGKAPWLERPSEHEVERPGGEKRIIQMLAFPIKLDKGFMACSINRDVTEQRSAEKETLLHLAELEAVNHVSTVLRSAGTLSEMLPALMDTMLELMHSTQGSIWLYDQKSCELRPAFARGYADGTRDPPSHAEKPGEGIAGAVFSNGCSDVVEEMCLDPRIPEATRGKIPSGIGCVTVAIRTGDSVIGVLSVNIAPPRKPTENDAHLLTTVSEIAGNAIHRARLNEQTERHLRYLTALNEVDKAIASNIDLKLNLSKVLANLISILGIDAAAILLYRKGSQFLEYETGMGFRGEAIKGTRLHLGDSHAGRAALERRIVHIPDLRALDESLSTPKLNEEGFRVYYGVPLLAKGELKGVLELFLYHEADADEEWRGILDALAEQAAIAIDNASLFDSLQSSNRELAEAYDATIEGWSHALDLRDEETEGHTQRVTDTTVKLARLFSIGGDELVQVRWGALLHDIGKMGVPDSILLKPGPLTPEEWVTMKKHTVFAHEMLSPIRYLRSAIDIPYCHHEKWDGSGYPRGLKGEDIPLTARIFAVVDVWDALRSDRPYRSAWPAEKVLAHIESLIGTHFDPAVARKILDSGLLAG